MSTRRKPGASKGASPACHAPFPDMKALDPTSLAKKHALMAEDTEMKRAGDDMQDSEAARKAARMAADKRQLDMMNRIYTLKWAIENLKSDEALLNKIEGDLEVPDGWVDKMQAVLSHFGDIIRDYGHTVKPYVVPDDEYEEEDQYQEFEFAEPNGWLLAQYVRALHQAPNYYDMDGKIDISKLDNGPMTNAYVISRFDQWNEDA